MTKKHRVDWPSGILNERSKMLKNILSYIDSPCRINLRVSLTPKELYNLGIELSELDIITGKPCQPGLSYFSPSTQTTCTVYHTGMDPMEDAFMFSRKRGRKERRKYVDSTSPSALRAAYNEYMLKLTRMYPPGWGNIWGDLEKRGRLNNQGAQQPFSVDGAWEVDRFIHPHYQVALLLTLKIDEDMLTVAEVAVLASWMLSGMRYQTQAAKKFNAESKRAGKKPHGFKFHVIFPVLILTFVAPASVRIVQGYCDGKLKAQKTKLQNFNVPIPEYPSMMDSLLRWGYATVHGDTLRDHLPGIEEASDEELDEEEVEADREESSSSNESNPPGGSLQERT